MMASRGMGDIAPSKMPKGVKKARRDDTDFTEYNEGGVTESGPREPTDDMGRPKMRPDASMMQEGVRAMPRYAELSKEYKAVGNRLSASKKLDKDTYLEGYVDLDTALEIGQGHDRAHIFLWH